jgi:hypothetical protein
MRKNLLWVLAVVGAVLAVPAIASAATFPTATETANSSGGVTVQSTGATSFKFAVAKSSSGSGVIYTCNGCAAGPSAVATNGQATYTPPSGYSWVSAVPRKSGTSGNWTGYVQVHAAPTAPVLNVSSGEPVGDPLGQTWNSVFGDEFNGTSIDRGKWALLPGWGDNNVSSDPKNCTESGGNMILALPGDHTGCDVFGSQFYGAGANAHDLAVGDYVEARIWFPGPTSSPTSTIYNWPAFWAIDTKADGTWNAGEIDIAEAENSLTSNYHWNAGDVQVDAPAGNWGNSWHVYGVYRGATQDQVFWDGQLVGTVTTHDNGGPEGIFFTSGDSDHCCGAPAIHGSAASVLVDWVHVWH